MTRLPNRVLFLGGARSGKSTLAERRLVGHPAVTYVAPGPSYQDDPEWDDRIRRHLQRRPAEWTTLESDDLVGAIGAAGPGEAVLIDCLTLWLTAVLDQLGMWDVAPERSLDVVGPRIDALASAVHTASTDLVIVSNEVGTGIVPATPSGRLFRDLLGMCNAAVAAACDEVQLVVAGLPLALKGGSR